MFSNFQEPPISFPPSFRRKMGDVGICGDYTEFATLDAAFTTQLDKTAPAAVEDGTGTAEDGGEEEQKETESARVGINTAPSSSSAAAAEEEDPRGHELDHAVGE